MRHPLLEANDNLRKRMLELLVDGYLVPSHGNLLFVCGGNCEQTNMRPKFVQHMKTIDSQFRVFQPEFAMASYFSSVGGKQMDLGRFEKIIGEISHAIIIFPEAPGSYCETGYFANVKTVRERVILVLKSEFQSNDSFISMGPALQYDAHSKFRPTVHMDYENPDFSLIIDRITRYDSSKNKTKLDVAEITSPWMLLCLVYKIVQILRFCTPGDIEFVLNSLTYGHAPKRRARDILSILIGAGWLKPIGEIGHFRLADESVELAVVRQGFKTKDWECRLAISRVLSGAGDEFSQFLEEIASAA